jgi:hypothetical protein
MVPVYAIFQLAIFQKKLRMQKQIMTIVMSIMSIGMATLAIMHITLSCCIYLNE